MAWSLAVGTFIYVFLEVLLSSMELCIYLLFSCSYERFCWVVILWASALVIFIFYFLFLLC